MASTYPGHRLSCHIGRSYHYLVVAKLLFLFISLPFKTNSLSFEFPFFVESSPGVYLEGDASVSNSQIQLTKSQREGAVQNNYGRALYPKPIQLWDASPKIRLADFTTNFTFTIAQASSNTSDTFNAYGDGLTFLLVPENTSIPNDSGGGCLALFSNNQNHTDCVQNQTVVAIEFDTYRNLWDPYGDQDHIGIDINSIKSAVFGNVPVGLSNKIAQAFVSYHSTTKNLSVSLSINESSVQVSYSPIDLSDVLPQKVQVGFSASTGVRVELHKILAWSFSSTLEERVASSPSPASPQGGAQGRRSKTKVWLVAGIGVGTFLILIFGTAIVWFILRKKRPREGNIDKEFDEDAGPKRFAYSELSRATNNFAIEGKLGEGGFGGVYKGLLAGPGSKEIAVKKIKSGSNQGKNEYISEVKIISKLRHRNLVQLLGWCHDRGELLLVYEFMPNRSLDFHLFKGPALLPWQTRYKIALGLASALLYLHEECVQSVVHRDIKSSNVMLDSNFNPKLGDFGLARLADHDADLKTTNPAGTLGYMAPECLYSGKVSKESDVYSFGIVALELACGRKVIEGREEDSKVNLVEWVWDLYGKGLILESVDIRLEGVFDEEQAKCLLVVGLWCSYLDVRYRPSIKQVISALNLETPLPSFNSFPPQTSYVSPGMNMPLLNSSNH